MDGNAVCSIRMHSARSAGSRVIWPEILVDDKVIESAEDLRSAIDSARIEWALIGANNSRLILDSDDPRIENNGFLFRIPERDARTGIRAECSLVLEDGGAD